MKIKNDLRKENSMAVFHIKLLVVITTILFLFSCILVEKTKAIGITDLLQKINQKVQTISDFTAAILQENFDFAQNTVTKHSGKVFFKKPDKLRIKYDSPSGEEVFFDGKYLLTYIPEINQVSKQRIENLNIPIYFIFMESVTKDNIEKFKKENHITPVLDRVVNGIKTYLVKIRPRNPDATYIEQSFWIDQKTYLPVRVRVLDKFGNVTTTTFSNIKCNIGLQNKDFTFNIPEGAEIIELE